MGELGVSVGLNLKPFPSSFDNGTTTYFPEAVTVSTTGAVGAGYPGSGTVVRASVQPDTFRKVDEQGIVRFYGGFCVNLLDDPATLNGGKGCKRGDGFLWSGDPRLLVAQDDAVKVGSVWPVRCMANE